MRAMLKRLRFDPGIQASSMRLRQFSQYGLVSHVAVTLVTPSFNNALLGFERAGEFFMRGAM